MKKRKNKKIFVDKDGRNYQKQSYFIGGKMKFYRVYLIDGMPVDEFYAKNATEIEHVIDGNFHLIDYKEDSNNYYNELNISDKKDVDDLPF